MHSHGTPDLSATRPWHINPFRLRGAEVASDVSEAMYGVWIALNQSNQQRSLNVGFSAPLLPILQCPHIRTEVAGEQAPR